MRFLADENFPGAAVAALAEAAHDTAWIRTRAPGASDPEVLAIAVQEQRVLLTFDKDFGELAAAFSFPQECGVVLFRVPLPRAAEVGSRLAEMLNKRDDWVGYLSVIEPGRVRRRRLRQTR